MRNSVSWVAGSVAVAACIAAGVWLAGPARAAEELAPGTKPPSTQIYGSISGTAFVPGTDDMMVADGLYGGVHRYDLTTGRVTALLDGSDAIEDVDKLVVSPDGALILAGYEGRTVLVWDGPTGELLATLKDDDVASRPGGAELDLVELAVSDDGRFAAAGYDDGLARIWDLETRQAGHLLENEGYVGALAFVPGTSLLLATNPGAFTEWDAATGERIRTIKVHGSEAVAVSPDGMFAASSHGDGVVVIWDMADGQEIHRLTDLDKLPIELAFSPDGSTLAAVQTDGRVALWDANTGELTGTLEMPESLPLDLDFSPDGQRLVTASGDGVFHLWNVEERRLVVSATISEGEWATWTPDFAFVTFEGHAHFIFSYYDSDRGTIDWDDRFLDHMARPELVAKALAEN